MSVRALLLLAAVAVGVYGIDQDAKYLVNQNLDLGDTIQVLGEVLDLLRHQFGRGVLAGEWFHLDPLRRRRRRHRLHRDLRAAYPSPPGRRCSGWCSAARLVPVTDRLSASRDSAWGMWSTSPDLRVSGDLQRADVAIVSSMGLF